MSDEDRTTTAAAAAKGQEPQQQQQEQQEPRRSDGEDQEREELTSDGSDRSKKRDVTKSKSVFGTGLMSRMSISRGKRTRKSAVPVDEHPAAITAEAAVALDDLRGGYYSDLRWSVRPPDWDRPRPTQLVDTSSAGRGTAGVRERLRDVHDALAEIEQALDDVLGSVSGVTAEEWFARRPRTDCSPKPRSVPDER